MPEQVTTEPSTRLLERIATSDAPPADDRQLRHALLDGERPASAQSRRSRDCAAHMLLWVDDPQRVLQVGVDHLAHELGAARADAALVDETDDAYRPNVVVADDEATTARIATTPLPNQHPVLRAVWRSPGSVSFDRVEGNRMLGTLQPTFTGLGMTAMLATSISHRGTGLGLLCLDETDGRRHYSAAEHAQVDHFVGAYLAPVLHVALDRHARRRTNLTEAETAAVRLLADGQSYAAIARSLGKSVRTIDNQLRAARRKAGAQNAVELIRWWSTAPPTNH